MIIRKYGIELVRLKKQHIELIRQKRNLSYIQEKMIFKKPISRWAQWLWFKSINNRNNVYFLIRHNGSFIGLINGKDIDFEKRSCEGGIFIWEKSYWETHVPVAASIILNDYNFLLANFKINFAKALKSNKNAIEYNLAQGYKIIGENDDNTLILELTKEEYLEKIKNKRKIISKLTSDFEPLSEKNFSFSDDTKREKRKLYSGLPKDIQSFLEKIE